ncbi:MAG: carbohydrate ABC transporter permease [Agathobaculum sp.]|uniref:carbohydrate ABC transporter permease n=1 Tax=Agathobaculum sp. TaxID=2048138 RepID=UPI0025B812EB|nr:carbohydrate ABC transporter permease [Agathobaculum sp.]MCI7125526.1 carbohydrate ABC transporter permease [Agathobaculum sp.]
MNHAEKKKNALFGALLWILSLIIIYPLLMVILASFKEKREAGSLNITLPRAWLWENYLEVFERGDILRCLFNSVFVSVITVIIVIATASLLSYAIVRRDTPVCRLIDKLLTFGIIAPFAAMPTMQLLQLMGIYGSLWGMIFVYSALYLPFSAMMITSYIKGLPKDLDEAAVIDGATGMGLFVRIIVPLLKPIAATVMILVFMWSWNELQIPMYLLKSSAQYTLPMSVYSFYGAFSTSWNLVCADVIVVSLPVILLYAFAQKYVISGMTAGAVKM